MPQLSALIAWSTIILAIGTGGFFSVWVQEQGPVQDPVKSQSVTDSPSWNEEKLEPGEFPPKEDLVKEWEKPDFVLFVSGRLHGYIEPCGCTGLENQKGGILRRYEVLNLLRGRGWKVVPVDAGDQVSRLGKQSVVKLQVIYEAMCRLMGYQSISFGLSDLKLSATDLGQAMLDKMLNPDETPFLCSNVTVLDESLANRFKVIEAGGRKIAITAVVGAEEISQIRDDSISTISPQKGLEQVAPQIKSSGADLKVLICHASLEESMALAKEFPLFDVMITAGGVGDPTMMPELVQTGEHVTRVIQVGAKGMHVGLVGFWGAKTGADQIIYERVPLDARFEDFVKVKTAENLNPVERLFKNYQDQMKALYLNPANFPDIKPRKHPKGYTFVGSQVCNDCHDEEFDIWKDGIEGEGGPHARATKDLTDPGQRTWVARNYDPECLSCHVTGWKPQDFVPYESGYYDLTRDAHLHGNGCENCHGPGSQHVAAENGEIEADETKLKQFRKEVRMTMTQAREGYCVECHDLDNSPDFFEDGAFQKYWDKIAHGDGIDNVDQDEEKRCP